VPEVAAILGAMDLSAHERAILDFERSWWCFPGPKESAIRARLGLSTSHYYRVLGQLLESPAAFEYDPLTVKRLRRSRELRRRSRLDGRRADPGTR
jgi:hypothetical protein